MKSVLPHQSFAFSDNFAFFLRHEENQLVADIVDIENDYLISSLRLPHDNYQLPHANVCCFGSKIYSNVSIAPLLYVSQWSYYSERGIIVYDFYLDEGVINVRPVQFILPIIPADIIGAGDIDWVVDPENEKLYAFAYKLAGPSTIEVDNEEIITLFNLPSIEEGEKVNLSCSDIIQAWHFPTFNYSQDKCYHNNKIYILSGGYENRYSHMNKIRVFNTLTGKLDIDKSIISTGMGLSEPEGISFYKNMLLMSYASGSNVLWHCVLE